MKPKLFASLMLFFALHFMATVQAQYNVDVKFREANTTPRLYLVSYFGHDVMLLDSVSAGADGVFRFKFDKSYNPGMYRIENKQHGGIDLVFNFEDVEFITDEYFRPDSLVVNKSEENKIFIEYIQKKNSYESRLDMLEPLLIYYPSSDTFYVYIEYQVSQLQKEYTSYLENVSTSNPDMVVSKIINLDQLPKIDPNTLFPQLRDYYKQHYFDGIDLSDTVLAYTPILTSKAINYLSLFLHQGASKGQQEEDFIQAVDSLMALTANSKTVQEVMINYLIEGFQMYGFEKVFTYLVENYVIDNSCISDQDQSKLSKRIEGFRKMAVGNQVANFGIPDRNGNLFRLNSVKKDHTILFFWASWCPHCGDAIPALKEIYNKYGNSLEIIGISVDEDRTAWELALDEKQMPWVNLAEMQGWDGKAVQDYYVYATPTYFLIDKNLNIVAKPGSLSELEKAVKLLD